MLANDSVTIAIEIPIWLTESDLIDDLTCALDATRACAQDEHDNSTMYQLEPLGSQSQPMSR